MTQFELTFWNAAGKFYTITEASNQKMCSRSLEWTENYSRKLTVSIENRSTVPAENLLSTSFAGWDAGTGALEIGMDVNYFVYPTSALTTKTDVFWGIITELSASKGILTITAKDKLEKFEYIQPNTVIFANYRDQVQYDSTEYVGARTIDAVTDAGIVKPAALVAFAAIDQRTSLTGTGSNLDPLMTLTPAGGGAPDTYEWFSNAQAFVALGDGMIGLKYYYQAWDITVDGHIHCAIQADIGGLPSGVDIAYDEHLVGLGDHTNTAVQVNFASAWYTVPLEKGKKYWIVFTCDNTIMGTLNTDGGVNIIYHTAVAALPYTDHYWWKGVDPVVAWTESGADMNLTLLLDFADYEEVAVEDYYFDDAADTIVVNSKGIPLTAVDSYYWYRHGKVSYYYNTITTQTIFERLVGFDTSVTGVVDTDCDTTYSLYQTRGKSVGECFRELCDTFETTGARNGVQHIVAAYHDAGTDYIHVGFRNNTAGRTFACGADSTVDDELRINSVNLKQTATLRPASVMVVGKAINGGPIIVQRDDRALGTSSFRTKTGLTLTTTHTDEAITTLADADRKAWQILDSITRGIWEGSITVAGVFPDLFDLNTASESYGAGGHIHLKYSPLGINNAEFHVKGIILHENTTEIQITNEDVLVLNALTDARGRAERSESFVAPDDPFITTFVSGFTNSVPAVATPLYAQLEKAEDTAIDGCSRVLCTKITTSRYNDITYHAEFETNNGYTIDGTSIVNRVALYDAATGGDWITSIGLPTSEQFPKWRTTRVVAEIHMKIA